MARTLGSPGPGAARTGTTRARDPRHIVECWNRLPIGTDRRAPRIEGASCAGSCSSPPSWASRSAPAANGAAPTPTQSEAAISSSPSPAPTATPIPSPGFALRAGTATGGCDAIGLEYQSLTWQIDPAADEPVTALTDTGVTLLTYWAPGFTAGTGDERVIRDPAGVIVVRDGDQLRVGDRLAGYYVCLGPETLWVFTQDPQ